LKIEAEPALMHSYIARDCIAQYQVGHSKLLRRIEVGIQRSDFPSQISVIGASFFGPAMNACIEHANRVAKRLLTSRQEDTSAGSL
jgi:protoporphyrinogen oxidase